MNETDIHAAISAASAGIQDATNREFVHHLIQQVDDLAEDRIARNAKIERLHGLLWNATKPDSSPLWWCLDDEVKREFRTRVEQMRDPRVR